MTWQDPGKTTRRTARAVGAAGFIVVRWLAAVCNVPALCGWLDGGSALLAMLYLGAYVGLPAGPFAVLRRRGAQLLAATCMLSLADGGLGVVAPERLSWLVNGLDLAAWVWVLWTSVAASRWLTGDVRASPQPRRMTPRHVIVSALIMVVLGLQVWALFRPRPTWWPFIDYPLYSAAQIEPIRTVHYRLYGLTANDPVEFFELTSDDLGMSWFVFHTELIPEMFDRPSGVLDDFSQTLARANMPALQFLVPVRTTFTLVKSELEEAAERRLVPIDSAGGTPSR